MAGGVIPWALNRLETLGRRTAAALAEVGLAGAVLAEAFYWAVMGGFRGQPVRLSHVVRQAVEVGLQALPIVTVLSAAIGTMLAIQGIYTLSLFGAESYVTMGLGMSVVREFSPLITGILIAGRTGSSLAARLGTMHISQEVDALKVMGINPVRFLVSPALLAMLVMGPALTLYADFIALFCAGIYVGIDLGVGLVPYTQRIVESTSLNDLWHGLGKSVLFAAEIVLIGVVNGANVSGGAEGVGRVTTRAVVQAISAIVITDMVFALLVMR